MQSTSTFCTHKKSIVVLKRRWKHNFQPNTLKYHCDWKHNYLMHCFISFIYILIISFQSVIFLYEQHNLNKNNTIALTKHTTLRVYILYVFQFLFSSVNLELKQQQSLYKAHQSTKLQVLVKSLGATEKKNIWRQKRGKARQLYSLHKNNFAEYCI